jgi:uncharacterized protein with HEPN domain
MSRDFKVYLEDMLEACQRIERYLDNVTYDQFIADTLRVDAVLRNVQIIGEAARAIPDEIRQKYPNVEWQKIVAIRNVLAHEYFRVKLSLIWEVVQENLPALKPQISEILEQEP